MIKTSALESAEVSDSETSLPIFVTTTCRKLFRQSESYAHVQNSELNKIIAEMFSKSSHVKIIKTKDGKGEIRKSDSFYFIASYSDRAIKVITITDQIKEGSPKKYPAMIETSVTDNLRERKVRVSVTARKAMKKAYPNFLIEDNKNTVADANPQELSEYLAKLLSENDDKVKKTFKMKNGDIAEIRGVGLSNMHFISVIRDTLDIISIQDTWLSRDSKERRSPVSVLREGFKGGRG